MTWCVLPMSMIKEFMIDMVLEKALSLGHTRSSTLDIQTSYILVTIFYKIYTSKVFQQEHPSFS
jgi:hypothetical protein